MDNIFELATRQKARFSTSKGNISVEDLWDLTLSQLDDAAKHVNKLLKDSSEESFVKKQTTGDKHLALLLEVLKSIISTKLAEEEKRRTAAERKAKRDKLLGLIEEKESSALSKKSITSLRAELDKLDDGEEEG